MTTSILNDARDSLSMQQKLVFGMGKDKKIPPFSSFFYKHSYFVSTSVDFLFFTSKNTFKSLPLHPYASNRRKLLIEIWDSSPTPLVPII
jgi:hypothetical protein